MYLLSPPLSLAPAQAQFRRLARPPAPRPAAPPYTGHYTILCMVYNIPKGVGGGLVYYSIVVKYGCKMWPMQVGGGNIRMIDSCTPRRKKNFL